MATQPQLAANRLNAKQSTGPQTPEGKRASSRNAVRHGLFASVDSLPAEAREQFETILDHFRQRFPQPDVEAELHELALAWFRRDRTRSLEAAFLAANLRLSLDNIPDISTDRALLGVFIADCEHHSLIAKFHRLERAYTRDIEAALKTLRASSPAPARESDKTNPIPATPPPPAPSLNGPCPCGSGMKYKRCCGTRLRRANSPISPASGGLRAPADSAILND